MVKKFFHQATNKFFQEVSNAILTLHTCNSGYYHQSDWQRKPSH